MHNNSLQNVLQCYFLPEVCSYASGFDLFLQEQVFTENDGFFAWMFLKRRTLWQTILSFVWPLFALAVCLFPVYPYQCKIVVLYSCAGALLFIVSILLCKISHPPSPTVFSFTTNIMLQQTLSISHFNHQAYLSNELQFFACVVLCRLPVSHPSHMHL